MSLNSLKTLPLSRPGSRGADRAAVLEPADDEELARLARAIGHPARVKILRMLTATKGCVCGDFVIAMPLAQSTVSQHLKILKDAGLIHGEIDGPRVCYCLAPEALRRLRVLVCGL